MRGDARVPLDELRVDGGAARNDFLLQFQADLLGVPVLRPTVTESTALGAAYLAGLGAGIWSSDECASHWQLERRFEPRISRETAAARLADWSRAVERAGHWARE
jgi:glycerol kinase